MGQTFWGYGSVNTIEEETTPLPGTPIKVRFTGAGVDAAVDPTDPTRVIVTIPGGGGPGSGDVVGPSSATNNAVTRYDGTTGKLIQDSPVTISDTGSIALPVGETVDGRDVSVDGAKLDTIATGAAALSTNNPANVGTTAAPGSGTAASKDDHVHDLPFSVLNTVLGEANAALGINGQKVSNAATPTASSDLATKGYVDGVLFDQLVFGAETAFTSTTRRFMIVGRGSSTDIATANEDKWIVQRAGVVRNLVVMFRAAGVGAANITLTVRHCAAGGAAADTGITVTKSNTTTGQVSDTTHTQAVAPGDEISVTIDKSATVTNSPSGIYVYLEFTAS